MQALQLPSPVGLCGGPRDSGKVMGHGMVGVLNAYSHGKCSEGFL